MKIRLFELKKIVRDTLDEMYGENGPETMRSPDTRRDPEGMLATMWDDFDNAPETEIPSTEFGPETEIEPSPFTMRSR